MFKTIKHSDLELCDAIITNAGFKAAKVCVTYSNTIDRNMFVAYAANMYRQEAEILGVKVNENKAREWAESTVPDFNVEFNPWLLAKQPNGSKVYTYKKVSLMQKLGKKAVEELLSCEEVA